MSKLQTDRYRVVVNDEEQYSIWPTHRESPLGWRDCGKTGTREECLAYIRETWTDMRPLSLRERMEDAAPHPESGEPTRHDGRPDSKSLVERLSRGEHSVVASRLPEPKAVALRERIALGHVHVTFLDTAGGTEVRLRLDPAQTDSRHADFDRQSGRVHLEGRLSLDGVELRCVTDIDLRTLSGTGRLEPIDS